MNNREIKFRALNANNEIIYGLPYTDSVNETLYYKDFNNRLCWRNEDGAHCNQPYKNGTLMQYTGLKDKNGLDIYEGDVAKVKWQKDSIGGYLQSSDSYVEKEDIVVVEWMNIGWGFKKSDGKYFSLPKNCTIEVIGNIYENPELLK